MIVPIIIYITSQTGIRQYHFVTILLQIRTFSSTIHFYTESCYNRHRGGRTMTDNFASIHQLLRDHLEQYEQSRKGVSADPHQRLLAALEYPYMNLPNHDEFLQALRQELTADECRAWFAYPDFSYRADALRPEEAAGNADENLRTSFAALSDSLIRKGFLTPMPKQDGSTGYLRTYMLYLCYNAVEANSGSPLDKALQNFWMYIADVDGSRLRTMAPEHRVLPNPVSLTGKQTDGRIAMNVEIPDTREVIPTDLCEEMLHRCSPIAVINCVCRQAMENRGDRACDYPIKDVCFLFNEAAYEAIRGGWAKELTIEQARKQLEEFRELGLVQVISNLQHPLSLCNCCSCCCICLRTLARNEDTMAIASRFSVQVVNPDQCIGCGSCAAVCQMGAVSFSDAGVTIRPDRCIGCGQCVCRCPKSVLKMKEVPGTQGPDRYCVDRIFL